MKKKYGFTLIELLAVIVVLAIIALISVPIVLNIIESAKKGSAKQSVQVYIKSIEDALITAQLKNEKFKNGKHNITDFNIKIKGDKPSSGYVCIDENEGVVSGIFKLDKYIIEYDKNTTKLNLKEGELSKLTCKEKASMSIEPEAKLITYDGNEHDLISPGSTEQGTILYKINNGDYDENIPRATNAGEYKVSYYIKGNEDYIDSSVYTINVVIKRKECEITSEPFDGDYDGDEHSIAIINDENVPLVYSVDNLYFTSKKPLFTDVGEYTVYYKTNSDNYEEISGSNTVSIKTSICSSIKAGDAWDYNYTGSEQVFIPNCTGKYKIELWGASGGDISATYKGGNGAYTTGIIKLKKNEQIYIYVGQKGSDTNTKTSQPLTYNGGGNWSSNITSDRQGGGATDIRLQAGTSWSDISSLRTRIMVAAGGGGAGYYNGSEHGSGGAGGTLIGISPTNSASGVATGGTQTTGGKMGKSTGYTTKASDGAFGIGGTGYYAAGGGGGYYGGGGQDRSHGGAAGGSSYISGHKGCVAIKSKTSTSARNSESGTECYTGIDDISCSYHYSGYKFTDTDMIAGNSEMPSYNSTTMFGNDADGHARITVVSIGS